MDDYTHNSNKTIHPLFNLLNFIYSEKCLPFDLSHLDKLILIGLFKHFSYQGMFVSQKTLAKELNVTVRAVEMAIQSFKTKKLITVKKEGRRNYYIASIPEVRFGYQDTIPEVFSSNTRSFQSPTIEKHRETQRRFKNEQKQTTKFWEPGNPDYDRVNGIK